MKRQWRSSPAGLFITGQNLFVFGSSTVYFAILWEIAIQTSSGTWMMWATFATSLPAILISLWAGVWADQCDRRRLMMGASALVTALTILLAGLFFLGIHQLWLLLAIAAIRSLGSGVETPAGNALLPDLVPANRLTRLNGINQLVMAGLLLVTPIVTGYILSQVGMIAVFGIDLITALLGIGFLHAIPASPVSSKKSASGTGWSQIVSGIRYIGQHRFLMVFMMMTALAFILVAPSSQLSTLYVKRTFGSGVWRLTLNELFWTIGASLGGLFLTVHKQLHHPGWVLGGAVAVSGMAFAVMGITEPFPVYLSFMLISGVCMPLIQGTSNVLIQSLVTPAMMGRVFSVLQMVSTGIYPLAMMGFGPLADRLSIAPIFMVTGGLEMIVGVMFMRFLQTIPQQKLQ